jgi:hypothetical protein
VEQLWGSRTECFGEGPGVPRQLPICHCWQPLYATPVYVACSTRPTRPPAPSVLCRPIACCSRPSACRAAAPRTQSGWCCGGRGWPRCRSTLRRSRPAASAWAACLGGRMARCATVPACSGAGDGLDGRKTAACAVASPQPRSIVLPPIRPTTPSLHPPSTPLNPSANLPPAPTTLRWNCRSHRAITRGALQALAYVHAAGVVHGALGSGSLMLSTFDDRAAARLVVKLDNVSTAAVC